MVLLARSKSSLCSEVRIKVSPKKNKFLQALASGDTQYGCWLSLPDNSVAEIAAIAGFDWLLIDHEHGPFELRTIMSHLQAMAPFDVAPVVRPMCGDVALIKKLLDIGVETLLVPMVNTAEQAAELVSAIRYPPAGIRGLGTSMARASRWNQIAQYAQEANDNICLIVQAETALAMDNLEAILAVDGVDGVFIGPSDLAASMGHLGNPECPEVVATIRGGLETIRAAGKYAGLLCLTQMLAAEYVKYGANFIGVGIDTSVLSQGMKQIAEQFKSADKGKSG